MAFLMQAYRTITFSVYGALHFTKSSFLDHAKSFRKEDMEVDMTGKNCIVTGANSGIGYASAESLAASGATVILVCRNKERGENAVSEIQTKTGNTNVHLELCDLSLLKDVKDLAHRFLQSQKPLNVLIHNAGVMEHERKITGEGLEFNFAVNVAAPYTLTELLLPALEKCEAEGRVITVSSGGMYGSPLSDDLQYSAEKFNGLLQYSFNKRLQVALTERWASLHKRVGFYSMHPGWVDTSGVAKSLPDFKKRFNNKLRTWEQGADTIVWLAMQPNAKLKTGAFYFDRSEAPKHLAGCRTTYTEEQVDRVIAKVRASCGL